MSSLNSVQIIGRLGQDPETRAMPNGNAVANLSIATSEQWKDKQSGEKKERTEWHRVCLFGRIAEVAGECLSKGDLVYIGGSLRTRKWTDKQGVERYSTEIMGSELKMLHTKGRQGSGQAERQAPAQRQQPAPDEDFSDDIPFSPEAA